MLRRVTANMFEPAVVGLVCAVCILLLALTLVPLEPGDGGAPEPASMIASSSQRPIASELMSAFRVLRKPPSSGARPVPHQLAVTAAYRHTYLLNASRARSVRVSGHWFWIFPGSRGVCLSQPPPRAESLRCAATDDASTADDGGLRGASTGPRNTTFVYGLAPDVNRSVGIVLTSGTVVHVPVIANVYAATVHAPVQALIVKDQYGRPRSHRL